jgi:hypothetical protein
MYNNEEQKIPFFGIYLIKGSKNMKERILNRKIGIAGLIVVAMMLAMVPTASAGEAFTWVGNVTYSTTGEWVPEGWQIQMENLDHPTTEFAGQPWQQTTQQYMYFSAHCDGEMENNDDHIYINVTSPDGGWFGEFTARLGDMDTLFGGKYVRDIPVYEQEQPLETFTKDLALGWNLISLPLTPLDNSTSAVLTGVSQDAVKSYNAATHLFEDATTMDPGTGYFVHVTTAGDWTYEGTAYESMTTSLSQGLNMVGWTNTSANLPDALSSITNSYRYVAHWNATSQGFEVYEPNAPAVFNDFTTMERGEGYFIAATASCTLTSP